MAARKKVAQVKLDGLTFNAKVWRKGETVPLAHIENKTLRTQVSAGKHPHFEMIDAPIVPQAAVKAEEGDEVV